MKTLSCLVVILLSTASRAQPVLEAEQQRIGLKLEISIGSANVFRGMNVFSEDSQADQRAMFAPGITYSLPQTGIWFAYWSAYQWTGGNRSLLVDAGLGNEQNLVAGYDLELSPGFLSIHGVLTYYFYPFASETVTGASVPSFLEPSVTLRAPLWADLALQLAYFAGLQSEIGDLSYLYFRPEIGKRIEISRVTSLSVTLGIGYKRFRAGDLADNTWDLGFDWQLPLRLSSNFLVTPSLHFAWTNLRGKGIGDEYVVWACLKAGVDL